MFFRQVLHRDLGCASYVVADGGEAAVVDPKREIEEYLRLAEEEGFEINQSWRRTTTPTTSPAVAGSPRRRATIHVPYANEVAGRFSERRRGRGLGVAGLAAASSPLTAAQARTTLG